MFFFGSREGGEGWTLTLWWNVLKHLKGGTLSASTPRSRSYQLAASQRVTSNWAAAKMLKRDWPSRVSLPIPEWVEAWELFQAAEVGHVTASVRPETSRSYRTPRGVGEACLTWDPSARLQPHEPPQQSFPEPHGPNVSPRLTHRKLTGSASAQVVWGFSFFLSLSW